MSIGRLAFSLSNFKNTARPFCCALLIVLFTIAPLATAHAEADKYYAPPQRINSMLHVRDRGLSDMFVLFQRANSSFTYDSETKTIDGLRFAIDVNSLMMTQGGDLNMFQALLDTLRYPEISFVQSEPATLGDNNQAEIKGNLTARRMTKETSIHFSLNKIDSSSGDMGVSIKATIHRPEFNMVENTGGPNRFGNDFGLALELQALKQ